MRNSRYRFTRLVMVLAAIVMGASGIYVVARPSRYLSYLDIDVNKPTVWLVRLAGVLMIAFAAHQATTSRQASDPSFRKVALISTLVQGALAAVLYTAPGAPTTYHYVSSGVSALFGLLYVLTLPVRPTGYRPPQP